MKKKLNIALNRFKKHPLTYNNSLFFFLRYYVWFNVISFFCFEVTFTWIGKVKLIIRKGDAGLVGNYYYGLNEFEDSMFLLHFTKKTDTFVDVGANLGHYSLLLSGIIGCKSIAIEPIPTTFNQLSKIVSLNNLSHLIKLMNLGISNKKEKLYFSSDKNAMNRVVNEDYTSKQLVHVDTLNNICKDFEVNILKIDVEGYEKFVLEGADLILQNENLKIIMLEINNSGKQFGVTDNEIYQQVLGFGFKPFSYDSRNRKVNILDTYNSKSFNTIFMRDEELINSRTKQSEPINIRNHFF